MSQHGVARINIGHTYTVSNRQTNFMPNLRWTQSIIFGCNTMKIYIDFIPLDYHE